MKKTLLFALLIAGMLTAVSCSNATKETSQGFKGEKLWEFTNFLEKKINDLSP